MGDNPTIHSSSGESLTLRGAHVQFRTTLERAEKELSEERMGNIIAPLVVVAEQDRSDRPAPTGRTPRAGRVCGLLLRLNYSEANLRKVPFFNRQSLHTLFPLTCRAPRM